MDDIQLAWAAGLLDGEGSFSIKRVTRNGVVHYQLWLVCGMAHIEPNERAIRELHSLFDGHVGIHTSKGNRLNTITWTVVSQKALVCLERVAPYLRVKKRQAELLIEFQRTCISRTGPKKNANKLRLQENYFYRVRELNFKNRLHLQRLSEKTPKGEATV